MPRCFCNLRYFSIRRASLFALPWLLIGCVTPPSPKPAAPEASPFEATEYLAQEALPIIKASMLWARDGSRLLDAASHL